MDEQNGNENKNQVLEELKNIAKNEIMKKLTPWLLKIAIPVILVVLAGVVLLGVFNGVGDFIQDIVNGIVEFFTIDPGDGAIIVTDEQIDTIINGISDMGISINGLKLMGDVDYSNPDIQAENEKALRKYIKEFYEAQAMTQTLNTKPNWVQENILNGGKPYGTVYVYRVYGEADTSNLTAEDQLKYIKYEDMLTKQKLEDSTILKNFSIDGDGRLVVAGWREISVEKNGTLQSHDLGITLEHIDYKNEISQYTTSMNFLVYLTMITQNPEFVSAVTDLVKNSEIRLTVLDTKTYTIESETYTYTENIRKKILNEDGTYTYEEPVTETKTDLIKTTTDSRTPIARVTYAKTWFCEQTITYNKKNIPNPSLNDPNTNKTIEIADEIQPEIEGEGIITWKTDQTTTYHGCNTTEYDCFTYEEGTRGDVTLRVGTRGSQGIKDKNGNGQVDNDENVDENSTFIGLLDNKFKIPNTSRYQSAGGNLVSGAEMLFYLLQKDSASQNLELVMRYILNEYQNTDKYGNIDLENLSEMFSIKMSTTGSNFIVNTSISTAELCITDEEILKEAIEKIYSGKMKENLTNEVPNFIAMQNKYHVNAVFAMAVTIVESSAGTNWAAIDESTYNWYSITGSYNGNTYKNPNSSNSRTWRVYPSFKEATFDFGDLIANGSYYFQAGKYTVEEIAATYCNEEWGKTVISVMNEIYAAAGIELPGEGFIIGGVTTDEAAAKLQEYIENNLIHTKYHVGNSQYQGGPFAQWWTAGYNNLAPFQCTWWANGRASMYLEQYGTKYKKYPIQRGNGGEYYDINKSYGWFNYGTTPKPNSIISWKKGNDYGHVAYVEGVSSSGIYISHAGSGKSWLGIQKIPLDGSIWSGYTLNGYIYLDEPI